MDAPQPPLPPAVDAEDLTQYLERLLQAERFRKSPSLRQLLEYLVRKCAEGSADDIKESTIAMDVFGRPTSFDSRLDNSVRVQAHRLRKTLEKYYEAEGAADEFRITIPKGSYIPAIQRHQELAAGGPAPGSNGADGDLKALPAGMATRRPRALVWLTFAGVFLAGVLTSSVAFRTTTWRRAPGGGKTSGRCRFRLFGAACSVPISTA